MSIERCPVCNGSGRITEPAPAYSSSAVGATRTCHGCLGKGWIGLDEALIRADERKVMARELTEEESDKVGCGSACELCGRRYLDVTNKRWDCDFTKPNESCPIRKAGGL